MNVRGLIIDVSSNNHGNNAPINWHRVRQAGIVGAVIKATQMDKHGVEYVNPWYHRDLAGAISAGIPAIAYHWASIADHSAGFDPSKEAKFFVQKAGPHYARVVDVETAGNVRWANAFLAELDGDSENKAIYGGQSATDPSRDPRTGKEVPIYAQRWVAAYPGPVHSCVMHQFTDKGQVPGIFGNVDLSRWLGTRAEFIQLFGAKPPNQIVNIVKPIKKLGK